MKYISSGRENTPKTLNKDSLIEFFTKRREGADKIAVKAKEKGGPATLTYWHFEVKDSAYKEIIQAITSNKDESHYREKWESIIKELQDGELKQEQFQKAIGRLEVVGEAIAQMFN